MGQMKDCVMNTVTISVEIYSNPRRFLALSYSLFLDLD